MVTSIPRVTVTTSPGGWLATCAACQWEQLYALRGAADCHAHDHQKTCNKRQP